MGDFSAIQIAIRIAARIGFRHVNSRRDRREIPLRGLGSRAGSLCDRLASERNIIRVLLDLGTDLCRLAIHRDIAHAHITNCGLLTETIGTHCHDRRLAQRCDLYIADLNASDTAVIIATTVGRKTHRDAQQLHLAFRGEGKCTQVFEGDIAKIAEVRLFD